MVSLGALAAGQLTRRCGFAVFFLRVGVRHGSHHARVRERALPRVLLLPRTGDMSLVGGAPPSVGGADAAGAGDEPVGDAGSDAACCISVVVRRQSAAVALYDSAANELSCAELHVDDQFSQLSQLVERLGPATVVLPAHLKNNDGLCVAVAACCPSRQTQRPAPDGPSNDEDLTQTEGLCFFPGREFTLDAARDRLSVVLVSGMPQALSSRERLAFLASAIDLESTLAWCAAGGLLAFLLKHDLLANVQLNTNDAADALNDSGVASDDGCCVLYLNAIRRLPLQSVMRVSGSTLRALHVVKSQAHPRMLGAGRSKEGLSLFSRLNRTRSGSGGRLLRSWIHAPSTSVSVIQERQRVVKALADPANCGLAHTLSNALKNVKNVATIVSRVRTVRDTCRDWHNLLRSARALLVLRQSLVSVGQDFRAKHTALEAMGAVSDESLREVCTWIENGIDFPTSLAAGSTRPHIRDGFSQDLDELRRCFDSLDGFLTDIGVQEMDALTARGLHLDRLHIVFLPRVGYLLVLSHATAIEAAQQVVDAEDVNDTNSRLSAASRASTVSEQSALAAIGLDFVFTTEEHVYFKNARCHEIDATLGDISGAIEAVEQKAVCFIRKKVTPHLDALWKASLLAAEVDVLLSLSEVAKEPNWVCPDVVEDRLVDVDDGRHPLAELTVPSLVANSTKLHGGSVACVTGPVFSGKSVYCAQVALIVLLAQVGSFVPAVRAKIGVFDALFTRVQSTDSVSVGQSSFFTDCSQIATMLQQATRRSLLVVDEFGKGTNEQDGLSLLGSLILNIIKRPIADAPIMLLTTHFWEVLAEPYVPMRDPRLHVFSMDVLLRSQERQARALPASAPSGAAQGGREALSGGVRGQDGQGTAAAPAAATLDDRDRKSVV